MTQFPNLPPTPGLPEADGKGEFLRQLLRCSASLPFKEYLELIPLIEDNRKGCLGIFMFWKEDRGRIDIHQHDLVAQLIKDGDFRQKPIDMDLKTLIDLAKSHGFKVYSLGEEQGQHRIDRPMQVAQRLFMTNDGYCAQIDELNQITWDPTPIKVPKKT